MLHTTRVYVVRQHVRARNRIRYAIIARDRDSLSVTKSNRPITLAGDNKRDNCFLTTSLPAPTGSRNEEYGGNGGAATYFL